MAFIPIWIQEKPVQVQTKGELWVNIAPFLYNVALIHSESRFEMIFLSLLRGR